MRRLLNRFAWQNLDLSGKIRLLVVAQAIIVLLVTLVLIGVLRQTRERISTVNDTIIQANQLLNEMQRAEVTLATLEQSALTDYTTPDYDPVAEEYSANYDRAVATIRDDLDALEALLENPAVDSATAAAANEELNALANTLTERRRLFRTALDVSQTLSTPEEGLIAELEADGNRLGSLTVIQSSEVAGASTASDLVNQGVLIRRLEEQLVAFGTEAELDLLQTAVTDLETTYNRLPSEIRVEGLPETINSYLMAAQNTFDETQNLQSLGFELSNEVDDFDAEFEALSGITTALASTLNASIEPVEAAARVSVLVGMGIVLAITAALTSFFGRSLSRSVAPLIDATGQLEAGDLGARAEIVGNDEFTQLASSFNSMATQLESLVGNLEQRVAERTRDLTITAEIGRAVTANTSRQALMNEVVELIRERFGFYHAQIFIVDAQGVNANLAASTGKAGRELLARQHFLPVGSQSVIGRVTERGEPVIALDTSSNPTHRRNELLPDTRAEMALPMRVGDRIIGALDVQSVSPNAFNEDTVAVFQIMADQLAIALENARLFNELQSAEVALQTRDQQSTVESWRNYRRAVEGVAGFALVDGQITRLGDEDVTPIMREAIATRQVVRYINGGEAELAIPIVVRGVVVGAFTFTGEGIAALTDEDLGLVEAIMDRVTLALDNLRLVEETVRRAEYEQVVNEITAKIVGQTDINYILQTTVQELGRILRAPRTSVQLKREGDN